jgi:hypothetical protein
MGFAGRAFASCQTARSSPASPQGEIPVWLQLDLVQLFRQASVVVIIALRHAPQVESLGDDGIGYSQPEQFRVLQMAKT